MVGDGIFRVLGLPPGFKEGVVFSTYATLVSSVQSGGMLYYICRYAKFGSDFVHFSKPACGRLWTEKFGFSGSVRGVEGASCCLVPASQNSVGTHQGNQPTCNSSQLAEPLWTDPLSETVELVCTN